MAINISPQQFRQDDFSRMVARTLDLNLLPARLIELELTESAVMHDLVRGTAILRELKSLDLCLAIDDFGTGYSSLAHLQRFPIDTLKVDQSFVRNIANGPKDASIVATIIHLAHSLRCKVVAEGVETEAQLHYLRRHNCDQVQGYYFSRPVSSEDFKSLLCEDHFSSASRLGGAPKSDRVHGRRLAELDRPSVGEAGVSVEDL
jgi:EAL domain-containing protein (putative c-di-GMP-specific phosphodiesterase class I)